MAASILRRRVAIALLAALCWAAPAGGVRVKNLADVKGVRGNQLIGYGLIVGLAGTGDKNGVSFTSGSLASVLSGMGIGVDPQALKVKNVASVLVTAELPPFARSGSRLDAVVSSLGDASSLQGGMLAMTPLYGADGEIYAIAQGAVSVGGFSEGGSAGSSVQKNHPTVGRLVSGVSVERELPFSLAGRREFELALRRVDFTTARRTAQAINAGLGAQVASSPDPGTVLVVLPESWERSAVEFLAEIEGIEVEPDAFARVVINERTGTVVMGETVSISTVAVSHGALTVSIGAINEVSQPAPFSDGETVPVRNETIQTVEEDSGLSVVGGPVTIAELVRGLNAMGVTPRDLIAILQAIDAAGALSAQLEIL